MPLSCYAGVDLTFMAKHAWIECNRRRACLEIADESIGMADTRCDHFDQEFAGPERS
jgi:hypothetical protein